MSTVTFQSRRRAAELRGWERAWLGWLARGPALAAWDLDGPLGSDRGRELLALVDPSELARFGSRWSSWANGQFPTSDVVRDLRAVLHVSGLRLAVAGVALDTRNVEFNTACVVGSPPIQLAVKLHGYCEAHAYVDEADREWLADVVEDGLRLGVFREVLQRLDVDGEPIGAPEPSGWRDVQELLRDSHDPGPVVTSYSVTEEFPNASVANFVGNHREWYQLSAGERWRLGVLGLRRRPWLRLAPSTLGLPTFDVPVTVYDLRAYDRDDRVRRAVNLFSATYPGELARHEASRNEKESG